MLFYMVVGPPLNSDGLPGLLNWASVREGFLEEDILELNI